MPTVTVPGANHSTVSLVYDSDANALLALHVAGAITAGLANHTIQAADNKNGPPPPLPPGVTGEFVQSQSGTTLLPKGYDYVVDSAKNANIFGNGDANEQILVGAGNLTFTATAGSGSIIGGGGNDQVNIMPSDGGAWLIALGDGNDSVRALGSGADTISLGAGKHAVQLGNGSTFLTTTGSDTILAAGGSETIDASFSSGKQIVYGNASSLLMFAGGPATVFGGSGSDTVFGGTGKELLEGGSAGNNFLQAGSGPATLFGGGDGDQLYAFGSHGQELHAAGGNETLFGGFSTGRDTFYGGSGSDQIFTGLGKNTVVAGSGHATVTASGSNLFEFMKSAGGGSELVTGLTSASQVHILLDGFGSNEVKNALANQKTKDGSVTITLSDHSTVTFQNIAHLTAANFLTGGAGGGFGDGDDHHGGLGGHDHHDWHHGHDGDHHH